MTPPKNRIEIKFKKLKEMPLKIKILFFKKGINE